MKNQGTQHCSSHVLNEMFIILIKGVVSMLNEN